MAEEKHSGRLDLSGVDVRVGCVLRKLGVDTIEKLLSLTQVQLSALKNCGAVTIAKIMQLQEHYGKAPSIANKDYETIDRAAGNARLYMNRLIIVAIAANKLIEGAKKSGRYYFRVTTKCFNVLRRSIEALRKQ